MNRDICAHIGSCLVYPVENIREMLEEAGRMIEPVNAQAAQDVKEFLSKMKRMELSNWQEYYVQTFDLMPKCTLYISVHLFGEESFKRSELMAGLKKVYENSGQEDMSELPDHLAVILKKNLLFTEEEWAELVAMCILPALPRMISLLEKNSNPYAHVLKAVCVLLKETENAHV